MATYIDLKDIKLLLFDLESTRIPVNEGIRARTCITVGRLHPEPGASRVEYELMRLLLAAEVHCRVNLNVKEVR